jgi:hypothetical protein
MSLTNAFETHALKYLLTADALTRPALWYVGLFTSDPTDTGTAGTEVAGSAYTRTAVGFTVTGDTASNTAAVEFPAATGGNWGTISHIGIMDASTGGNMIVHASLTVAKAINDGDVFRIPTGDLDITAS